MEVDAGMQSYFAELLDAYRGEVAGEAFFTALAQQMAEPEHARKWRTLARLEQFVANRLRAVLEAEGVRIPAIEPDWQRGLRSAKEYAALSWPEALDRLLPELDRYVREFEASESRMPKNLLPLAQFVTAHERALVEFVTLELAQQGADSLAAALRLLEENPLAPVERPLPKKSTM